MKKLMNTIKKAGLVLGLVFGGYVAGNIEQGNSQVEAAETTCPQVQNQNHTGVNSDSQDNIFTQYFKVTKIDSKGAEVVNQYNAEDTYYIDAEDWDLDFNELETGALVEATFNHDTLIHAGYNYNYIRQYKLVSAKDYNVNIDEDKYIYGIDNNRPNRTIVLEKDDFRVGDLVDVRFNSDAQDDIKDVTKVGMWKEDLDRFYEKSSDDSFEENAKNDVNKDNPNYVQTEDGSYVPKDFWEGGKN